MARLGHGLPSPLVSAEVRNGSDAGRAQWYRASGFSAQTCSDGTHVPVSSCADRFEGCSVEGPVAVFQGWFGEVPAKAGRKPGPIFPVTERPTMGRCPCREMRFAWLAMTLN